MKRCLGSEAFKDGRLNFRAYNYVNGIILDNLARQDLTVIYNYLLDYDKKGYASIHRIFSEAKAYNEKQKAMTEKERTKELKAKKYEDFSVEELFA